MQTLFLQKIFYFAAIELQIVYNHVRVSSIILTLLWLYCRVVIQSFQPFLHRTQFDLTFSCIPPCFSPRWKKNSVQFVNDSSNRFKAEFSCCTFGMHVAAFCFSLLKQAQQIIDFGVRQSRSLKARGGSNKKDDSKTCFGGHSKSHNSIMDLLGIKWKGKLC